MNNLRVVLEGGLGNQLFGWAAGLAISKKCGANLILDCSNLHQWGYQMLGVATQAQTIRAGRITYLPGMHTFFRTIRPLEAKRFGIDVYEDTFHYQPSLGDLVAPATLRGFFQSEKYFDSVASEIKSILWESQAAFDAIKMSQDLEIPQGFIAVNVRLGDYLKVSDYFVNLPPRYFELAIALAKKKAGKIPVVVFTDSLELCKRLVPGQDLYVGLQKRYSPLSKMLLMAGARAFVGSNSSFSWWSAYLGTYPDSNKIFPETWFVDDKINTQDLIPAGWTVAPVD
jgi:hypothetical protein